MVLHILSSYPRVPVNRLEKTLQWTSIQSRGSGEGGEGVRRNTPMRNSQNYCTRTGPPNNKRDGGLCLNPPPPAPQAEFVSLASHTGF